MAAGAAHLVDRILPAAPVRQYVLSFPYELSTLAAIRPDVLTALSRIFWQALRLRYRRWAKGEGCSSSEAGAVTGVQRFGSSLNVHVHFHLLALDGVYVKEQGALRFVPAPPPSPSELLAMLERIHRRAMKWLSRRGYLRDADASNAPPELSVAGALAAAGAQAGRLVTMSEQGAEDEQAQESGARPAEECGDEAVAHERFNLHAGVVLAAEDDMGRERLCRYLLRPPFALSRIRVLRDGNVSYRVKKVGRRGAKHRGLTPVEFLARLCALVPPPRYPLLRFAGVLAPRHAWRARIVPRPPLAAPSCEPAPSCESQPRPPREPEPTGDGRAALAISEALPTTALTEPGHAERAGPNILSVAHWRRLLGGELYAQSSRVDWATLLKRTWGADVRVCVLCGGRLVVRAVVTDCHAVQKILCALQRSRDPPLAVA